MPTDLPSELPPALADFLVSQNISYDDVIATIVDLIQRGYISYQNDELLLNKTTGDLFSFERELLDELFSGDIFLDYAKNSIDRFVDYNMIIAFAKLDAVRLGLAQLHESKTSALSQLFVKNRYLTREYLTQKLPGVVWQWLTCKLALMIYFVVGLSLIGSVLGISWPLLGGILKFISVIAGLFVGFLVVCIGFTLVLVFALALVIPISATKLSLSDTGKSLGEKYGKLKSEMAASSLQKDLNLSKEQIPYAIAFGQNTIWNERLDKALIGKKIKTFRQRWVIKNANFAQTVKADENRSFHFHRIKSGLHYVYEITKSDSNTLETLQNQIQESTKTAKRDAETKMDSFLKNKRKIATVNVNQIEFDQSIASSRVTISAGEGFLDKKRLVFDYRVLSDGEKPILKWSSKIGNASVKQWLEFYGNFELNDSICIWIIGYKKFAIDAMKATGIDR